MLRRGSRNVALPSQVRRGLQSILDEFRHSGPLQSRGFQIRRKLIFTGPPGCGKSLTALALANELGLPNFVVRFDAIIGSYLGQTATHLRHLFRFAESTASVLLFDEIDALGKRRGNPADVGELDRIVIALMQELELTTPLGFVIATSNVPEHLDRALWRRFDGHLVFPAPTKAQLKSFVVNAAQGFGRKLPEPVASLAVSKHSYAEAETVVSSYLRQQIVLELNGRMARDNLKPLSFFLNEQHELTRGEKEGGRGIPKYAPINWGDKGRQIQNTLHQAREKILAHRTIPQKITIISYSQSHNPGSRSLVTTKRRPRWERLKRPRHTQARTRASLADSGWTF